MRRAATIAAALALAAAGRAGAQDAAATLHLDVTPSVQLLDGDRVQVTYTVTNLPSSTDRLFQFSVRSPVPVLELRTPEPADRFAVDTREDDAPVASWGWLTALPAPGETAAPLTYVAQGLPGIVQFRGLRYTDLPEVDESSIADTVVTAPPTFDTPSPDLVFGQTVGVVPFPADASPGALGRSLQALVDQACALGWIDSHGVCNSLRVKATGGAGPLGAFLHELEAQRGKHVSDAAYKLLRPNAEYALARS